MDNIEIIENELGQFEAYYEDRKAHDNFGYIGWWESREEAELAVKQLKAQAALVAQDRN